ncbi:hypothetical protein THOM_2785 [Trachipleistophora hominis]|uniref:Uncharacterized protein n=1 Tax=Trachipleistophora hominis TaxID=72359 RepID=L7JTC6_TRAHO|nr:hypothetical protein THOM_2785 [Trachipleistophora hominis]
MTQPVNTGVSVVDLAVQDSVEALTLDDNGVKTDFDSAMPNGVLEETGNEISPSSEFGRRCG